MTTETPAKKCVIKICEDPKTGEFLPPSTDGNCSPGQITKFFNQCMDHGLDVSQLQRELRAAKEKKDAKPRKDD